MSDDASEADVKPAKGVKMTPALRAEIRGISRDGSLTETQKADRRQAAFDRARSAR